MADDEKLGEKKLIEEEGPMDKLMEKMMEKAGGISYKEYNRVREMVLAEGKDRATIRASIKVGCDLFESFAGRELTSPETSLLMEEFVSFATITVIQMETDGLLCEENTCGLRKTMEKMSAALAKLGGTI